MIIENYDDELDQDQLRELGFVPGNLVFKNLHTETVMAIGQEGTSYPHEDVWVYIGVRLED